MLTSFEHVPAAALQVIGIGEHALTESLHLLATAQATKTTNAITARLVAAGVTDVSVATYEATEPVPAWNHLGVSVAVAVDDWTATERALREWDADARFAAGFDSRVVASIRDGELAIPVGIVLFGSSSRGVPATEEYLQIVQVVHGLREIPHVYRAKMGGYLDQLVSISQAKNLRLRRPGEWPAIPAPQPLPTSLTIDVDDPAAWRSAVERAAVLAAEVDADDAGGAQLAVDLAQLDLQQVNAAAGHLAEVLGEAGILALEADIELARTS